MKPANFTLTGFVVLVAGFILAGAGAGLYAERILCSVSSSFSSCNQSSAGFALQTISILTLLLFGVLLIIVGAIFTAAGHITEQLHPESDEDKSLDAPLRMCVKCGRQVDPSASFCPSCGNPLPK